MLTKSLGLKHKFNVCADTETLSAYTNFERWIVGRQDKANFHAMRPLVDKRKENTWEWLSLRTIIYSHLLIYNLIGALTLPVGSSIPHFLRKTPIILIIPDGAAREDHHEYTKENFYNRLIDDVLYLKRKTGRKRDGSHKGNSDRALLFPQVCVVYPSQVFKPHALFSSSTFA